MSAAKHTPGPWSASKIDDRAAFNIFTPGQCSALLTLEPGKHNGADKRTNNVEADARLIAAAPELLQALKFLLSVQGADELSNVLLEMKSDGGDSYYAAVLHARAAIAKATGSAA